MRNILKQATEKGVRISEGFEYLPQAADEEKMLRAYMEQQGPQIEAHRNKREYFDALMVLSGVREKVDTFFDKVMVMVEDERVRANRLALLQTLLKEFSTIADFSEIAIEKTIV
jgi:glycyl-tRNA synthetase beta chain